MDGNNVLEPLREARINVRVKGSMAMHLENVIGPNGLYANQSEYIRDLIRHDMANQSSYDLRAGLLEGYSQLATSEYREAGPIDDIISRAEREMLEENNA